MPKMDWKIDIDNQTYAVVLEHNLLLGSRKIWINGDLIESCSPNLEYKGSVHRLPLGQHACHIIISSAIFRFYYQLFINGRPAEYEDDWWFSGAQKQAAFYQKEQLAWETVAKKVELTYLPDLNYLPEGIARHYFPIHRLIGKFKGFFVKVAPAEYLNDRAITLIILFRHGQIDNPNKLSVALRDDPQITKWLSRFRGKKDAIIVHKDETYLYVPINSKEEYGETLVEQILYLIKMIGQYAEQLPDECEENSKNHADRSTLKWVLINGFPWLFCQSCINQVPETAKKNQEAIKLLPSEMNKTIVYEIAALVMCLALFILLIPLNDIVMVFAICLFVPAILTAMNRASRKITRTGMLIAYGFSALYDGLVLIYYLVRQFIIESNTNLSVNLFWTILSQLTRNLPLILLFPTILAFVVPLILSYKRWQQKENLKPYLHPVVEILPSNIISSIDTK